MYVQIFFIWSPFPFCCFLFSSVVDIQLLPWLTRYRTWVNFSNVWSLPLLIAISLLFHNDNYDYYSEMFIQGFSFWTKDLCFMKRSDFGLQLLTCRDVSAPWTFFWNTGLNMLPSDSFVPMIYPTGEFLALQLIVLATTCPLQVGPLFLLLLIIPFQNG